MTKPDRSGSIRLFGALLLIFAAGVALRLAPWHNFITPEGVYLLEADNYEHLRKISVLLHNFPYVPAHDYYAGFPAGTGAIWSPLLDLTFAWIIKLLSGANTPEAVAYMAAALVPFLGMLAVIPLFLWARACFGAPAALLACAIFTLLPIHLSSSTVGRPDNELVEPIWAALLFFAYTAGCRREDSEGALVPSAAIGAATGVVATLSILYWRGAILWWGILAAHAFFSILYNTVRGRRVGAGFRLFAVAAFATAAALVSIVSAIRPWGLPGGMRFNIVSWFHAVSALMVMAALASASLAAYLRQKRGLPLALSLALASGLFMVLGALMAAITPEYFRGIFQGTAIVGGGNKWTRTIAQYRPLFTNEAGAFSLLAPLSTSTLLLFAAPFVLAWVTLVRKDARSIFFAFAGWAVLALTFINGRYETVLTLFLSVCGALLVLAVYRRLSAKGAAAGLIASGVVLLILFSPAFSYFSRLPRQSPFLIRGDLEESLLWMRDNTPETSHYLTPSSRPEYGVMSRWEYGGWIGAVARRPALATVYGIETHGMMESAAFFLATDNREFLDILDENRARYFILSKTIGALSGYAELLGRDSDGYLVKKSDGKGRTTLQTGPKYFNLVYVNLYLADGQATTAPIPFPGVGGVRLVFESASRSEVGGLDREIKQYKIFERVKGAVIEGRTRPGQRVALAGVVRTNRSRRFYSTAETVSGPDGAFSITAWYPTLGPSYNGVGVEGGYLLKAGSVEKRVSVTEKDVIEGGVLRVN